MFKDPVNQTDNHSDHTLVTSIGGSVGGFGTIVGNKGGSGGGVGILACIIETSFVKTVHEHINSCKITIFS